MSVSAFELLQESEELWSVEPESSLRCDGSVDSRHRRRLVLEALRAYDRLQNREAPDADHMAVFGRWPVCTLVGLTDAAARAADGAAFTAWLESFIVDGHDQVPAGPTAHPPSEVARAGASRWLQAWSVCWSHIVGPEAGSSIGSLRVSDVPGLALLLAATELVGAQQGMPEVRLDAGSGSLYLALPDRAGVPWTLHADGEAYPALSGRWHVPHPMVAVDCVNGLGEISTVPLVDPSDPLLVFGKDGLLVPLEESLSPDVVWLLHPGEPPVEAFEGTRRIVEEATPPPGWEQWWLGRVTLEFATAVRCYVPPREGHAAVVGRWRPVARTALPSITEASPVTGLLDVDLRPVRASAPLLHLPATASGRWTVEIRRNEQPEPLCCLEVAHGSTVDVSDLLPRPALGRFKIRVCGTEVRHREWEFTVAQGVVLRCDPKLRMLKETGGLPDAWVYLHAPPGMRATPSNLRLGQRDIGGDVELHGPEGSSLKLRVEPPHVAARLRTSGSIGLWRIEALHFTPDELVAGARIEVRLPKEAMAALNGIPEIAAGYRGGSTLQYIPGRRTGRSDIYRYDIGRLADTTRQHGDLQLWLDLPGQKVAVAAVHDVAAASGAFTDGTLLRLVGRGRGILAVSVHALLAPWVPPQNAELNEAEDAVALASPFRDGGPLLVTVRRPDTSGSADGGWPYMGSKRRSRAGDLVFLAKDSGVPALADPVEQSVANYLAGTGVLPDDQAALPFLWVAAVRARQLGRREDCAERLGASPSASLFATARSGLSSSELAVPLILSGLAAHRLKRVSSPDRVQAVWATAPFPALLLTSPLLPYLSGSSDWDRAELEPEEDSLLTVVSRRCGPVSLDLLAGRGLPEAHRTGFGTPAEIELMERLPQPQLDDIVRSLSLLPRWPLDADNRFLATQEAFEARQELRGILHDLPAHLDAILAYANGSEHTILFEALQDRDVTSCAGRDDQWQLAPALLFGFALLARLAAQGSREAAALERQIRPVWAGLAVCAQRLAAQDIQIAEFMVSGWHARDHT